MYEYTNVEKITDFQILSFQDQQSLLTLDN